MSWIELLAMEGLEDIRLPFESVATQESAEVVAKPIFCERECPEVVMQKSSPSFWKWRRVSLAISACNRMRLVVESIKAVDEQTAEKTGAAINFAFAEASRAQLPDLFPCADYMVGKIPTFNCKCFLTPGGKLRLEMESVEAVEHAFVDQVASEVSARVDFFTSLITGPVEESPDPELQNMIPEVFSTQTADVGPDVLALNDISDGGSFQAFLEEILRSGPIGEPAVGSTYSPRTSAIDEAMQSGIFDQFSEQHDVSDTESPLKTMEDAPLWKDTIINPVNEKIEEIYLGIDQASDRTKLEATQSKAQECSERLQNEIRHFQGDLNGMFNDLKTTLAKISKTVPGHIQLQLNRAISQVNHFSTKELKRFLHEANGITKNLVKVVDDLRYRNVSTSKMFQNCASSVTQLVESVLALTSKFISVADFNRYTSELYTLPNFRGGRF